MLNKDAKVTEEALSPPKSGDTPTGEADTDKCQAQNGEATTALITFEEGEQVSSIANTTGEKNSHENVAEAKNSDTEVAEVRGSEASKAEVQIPEISTTDVSSSETVMVQVESSEMNSAQVNDSLETKAEVKNSHTSVEEVKQPDVSMSEVRNTGDKVTEVIISDVSVGEVKISDTNSTPKSISPEGESGGGSENAGVSANENVQPVVTETPTPSASEPLIEISDDGSWDMKPQHELEAAGAPRESTGALEGSLYENQTATVEDEAKCAADAAATPVPVAVCPPKPLPRKLETAAAAKLEESAQSEEAQNGATILEAVADLCVGLKTLDNAKPYKDGEEPPTETPADPQHAPPPPPFRFGKFPKDVVYDSILENKNKTKSYWEQRMLCVADGECAPKVVDAVAKSPAVAKIAMELREMREREEELRRARLALQLPLPLTDSCSEYGSEDSMVSPPGYSHQRTDSMSSGHSSGSDFGRRRVTVKPLDEPDSESETPAYKRTQKETPIEREIRLAREREEELRREKGLPPLNTPTTPKAEFRFLHKTLSSSEQQHTQPPRPATTRIQQEIDEAVQRERELKEANGIQTSDENIVHKRSQTPDAVNSSTEEKESDPNSFSSSNNLSDSLNDGEPSAQAVPTKRSQSSSPSLNNSPFASPTHRFSSGGGQKGLMQRFYASHGRMRIYAAPRNTVPVVVSPPSVSPVHNQPPIQRKIIDINSGNDSQDSDEDLVKTPVRKGYQSAEEKIQAELQEMQKREEELRLLRAKLFAQSQPNLLSIGSIEEEEINHINGDGGKQTLQSAQSIPNLLDSDDSLDVSQDPASQKFQKNSPRKRSALIAEWESRIQKYSEH
ncbi:uncharacterized protein LOC126470094 isoform X6 [Schistocerca serialis cubense]|uniref:uncharacterized protein LOC126470094 isoform X4 n=1 Tax=Schistocerca serialis cubense TaxID=2023355 RepID=UPI00214EB87B|nr:uncharacterized protein LOC126470094 isoform X4 [Schistocerca serialis cubense]XP_049953610.1 uncharacterized protein LOC126470094 isoform X6 [Schistocerca serialis cubense]